MRSLTCSFITWRSRAANFVRASKTNPTLLAIAVEGFLTRLGFSMVGFVLPLYALSLGMSLSEVGFLYALRTATVFLVKPLMAWLADRCGRKRTLVAAVVLRCVMGLLFVFAYSPWHLYLLRILHGAMTAARDPSSAALIAEHGNHKSMASAFAWYSTARDLGRSLGFGAAGLLLAYFASYRAVFFISFLTSCAALVTVFRYVRERRETNGGRASELQSEPAEKMRRYQAMLPYATFALMISLSAEMMLGLFPVIATRYGHLSEAQAGIAASLSTVAILIGGPFFGWLADRVSHARVLGIRSVANTLSSLLYLLLPSFGGFVFARLVDDTGKAAFKPTWGAMLAEVSSAEPSRRASTMTFIDSAYTLGEMVAPLIAGCLLNDFGLAAMLGVRAALAVLTEIHSLRLLRVRLAISGPKLAA